MSSESKPSDIRLGVSGILYDEVNRRILLGKRAANDEALPGLWCSPGGGVENKENLDDALVREFSEEVGLNVTVGELISVEERFSERGHTVLAFYRVYLAPGWSIHDARALDGFDQIEWAHVNDIIHNDEITTPLTWEALKKFIYKQTAREVLTDKVHALVEHLGLKGEFES